MSDSDVRAGGAFVEIGGENSGLKSTLKNTLQEFKKFGAELRGIGLGLAGAMFGVGAAIYKTLSDSSKQEETTSKFNAVFQELAQSTKAWTDQYAAAIGRGKEQTRSFMAEMQDMFVPMGFNRGVAAELSKAVVTLSEDLGSFDNTDPAETMRDLKSALVGNHEAVRKYGIMITEITLNQQLMKMGIMGGTQAASEQQKAIARLQIIISGSSDAIGDAIRTSDSWANRTLAAKAAVTDLSESLGDQARGVLKPWLAGLIEVLGAMNAWVKVHPELISGIIKLFVGVSLLAAGLLLVGGAIMILGNPILVVIGIIFYLLDAFGLVDIGLGDLGKSFQSVTKFMSGCWNVMVDELLKLWESFRVGVADIADWIADKFDKISGAIADTWMVFLSHVRGSGVGEKELGEYFDKREQMKSDRANEYAKRKSDRHDALANRFIGLDKDIDKNKGIVGGEWNKFMSGFNKPSAPQMPNYNELLKQAMASAQGMPKIKKYGLVGIDAGGSLAENLGAAEGAGGLQEQQLQAQKDMLSTLTNIEQNTRNSPGWH